MQKIDYEAVLNRQQDARDQVLSVLIGMAARLDLTTFVLQDIADDLSEEGDSDVAKFLEEVTDDTQKFYHTMAEAKFFTPLVLKVQRPLSTNDPEMMEPGACMAYNEDRSLLQHLTLDADAMEWFEEDFKMYVDCRLWIDGTLQVLRRIEEQPW